MKTLKKSILFPVIVVLFFTQISAFSETINYEMARHVATNKIVQLKKSDQYSIKDVENYYSNEYGRKLFYVFEIIPVGFIVVSSETNLPPVIAYSFDNNFNKLNSGENSLEEMLISDIQLRFGNIPDLPEELLQKRNFEWQNLLDDKLLLKSTELFEQWPPEGTTSTGGWLETNWTQNAPYNNFCPMDPVTGNRSLAGCPAVAMAMIVNYFETLNGMFFTDMEDDYHHNYAGRNYWIDDDFEEQDFPSFPDLNAYLDTLEVCYENQSSLKENEKAALTFACGVAATQVFTSEVSGTFGVGQAFDAYMRFGFEDAVLMDDNDSSLYSELSKNMIAARPVHLAVVDEPVTMGHNVVVDGYNTDDFYHLNFGWGGSYNSWYLLPDEIPYGLTVIEGAILNIAFPPVYTGIPKSKFKVFDFHISPNPVKNQMNIAYSLDNSAHLIIEIFNLKGKMISVVQNENLSPGSYSINWNVKGPDGKCLPKGIYVCKIRFGDFSGSRKFIVN
jgi:hypothetical protein